MIIGNPFVFAIESSITRAYERLSLRALGSFVVHVGGLSYGVKREDATMLACSFDEVEKRLARRGKHTAPFAEELDGGKIADAFRKAIFTDDPSGSYFGMLLAEFRELFYATRADRMWAPDGDQAFDDGSFVLQFDVDDRVRLIAFKSGEAHLHDPTTLRDVWLSADTFYGVLRQWLSWWSGALCPSLWSLGSRDKGSPLCKNYT
jgi:Immunity protein 42